MSSGWIDTSELNALAKDLLDGAQVRDLEKVMHRAANNIKRTMREDASGHSHLPMLAHTVNYDLVTTGSQVAVVVGFEKKKVVGGGKYRTPGNLANIAAYGSRNNAPVMDITRGLRMELPALETWLGDLATRWVK